MTSQQLGAKIIANLQLIDAQGNNIRLAAGTALSFQNLKIDEIVIPPNTNFMAIPFPQGVTQAQLIAVLSQAMTDLEVAVIYDNQAALPVPAGQMSFLYNASGLWVSSVLGGTAYIVIGA